MKAPAFIYHAPGSIQEAVDLLAGSDNARLLAGGQSLMPMLNLRVAGPDHLVDLGRIEELRGISDLGDVISIAAMTTQRSLERSALVARDCPLLAQAVALVGHQQTRNRGTVGGSICHLDPGAELPVVACALDARLHVLGSAGPRTIAFRDFPETYLTSRLGADEIVTRIDVPKARARSGAAFLEFNRRPADFAIVSVAVQISLDPHGRVAQACMALGGVGEAPIRLDAAEAALLGKACGAAAFDDALATLDALACDGDDLYPAAYRHDLCRVLLGRALRMAAARAGGLPDV